MSKFGFSQIIENPQVVPRPRTRRPYPGIPADWKERITLSPAEVGRLLGVSPDTVKRRVRAGRYKVVGGYQAGEQMRIPVGWLKRELGLTTEE